ncbi:MAG: Gfo/Idh/MocA family oxidoreductase [Bacteroidetes bacterium]|nr:Gfo/Idh/MocA family oxidoreductase [Bacteroidota bacterium]MCY4206118.1 Gfo/Idh/MocA family oxidoreductase [Bacteroidota bacterium]
MVSRRHFVKSLASAAALPIVIPASALGRSHRPAPSERINMGFIGMGSMGMHNLRGFIEKPDVQVLAVCDVNPAGDNYAGSGLKGREPAREFVASTYAMDSNMSAYTGCDAYSFFWQILERDDIDAVCLALPDHWHAYMAVAAAKAGKDMYSEKPLSRTIHEGRLMVKAVRKYDLVFQTGSQQRSDQRFRHACELVRNGYIGEIQKVYAQVGGISRPFPHQEAESIPENFLYELWLGNAPSAPYHGERVSGAYNTEEKAWRAWRPYSAGHVADWGAHNFDISLWGLGLDRSGPVKIVHASDAEEEELTLMYSDNPPIIKKKGPHDGMIQFIGSKGWVGVSRGELWASDERLLTLEMKSSDTRLYHSDDHRRDFLNSVKTRSNPVCDVEIGHSSSVACLTSEICMRLERTLEFNPIKEKFHDEEANHLLTRSMRAPWSL